MDLCAAPGGKTMQLAALGADVRIAGASQDEAQEEVDRLVAEEGLTMLPPFDHPDIVAGQGTLGLEIIEDLPELDTVLVPVSGGGLAAGVALAVKAARPAARVIGISMVRGAAMHASLRAGRPVLVEELETLADSLGGGIGLDNAWTFGPVRALVEEVILVGEREIAEAIDFAYHREAQVVEGGGAVGIAALLAGRVRDPGTTAVIVSGRNIDMALHARLVSGRPVTLPGEGAPWQAGHHG